VSKLPDFDLSNLRGEVIGLDLLARVRGLAGSHYLIVRDYGIGDLPAVSRVSPFILYQTHSLNPQNSTAGLDRQTAEHRPLIVNSAGSEYSTPQKNIFAKVSPEQDFYCM
jgi:hypothetical protein